MPGEEEEDAGTVADAALYPLTVFGPTCGSLDVLNHGVLLPQMDVSDWVYFQNMGAYMLAAANTFNGFPTTETLHVQRPTRAFPQASSRGESGYQHCSARSRG